MTINSHLKTAATWLGLLPPLPPPRQGIVVGNVIGEMHAAAVAATICMWQVNGACNRERGRMSWLHFSAQREREKEREKRRVGAELFQLMGLTHACGQCVCACVWNSIEFIASVCFAAPELNCPQCVMVACVRVCVCACCLPNLYCLHSGAGSKLGN